MKHFLWYMALAAVPATALAEPVTVPYRSNLYEDSLWEVINTVEGTNTWEAYSSSKTFKGTGETSGVRYKYDRKNVADDWLISPGINLEKGKEYKVSFYGYANSDRERYRLCMSNTKDALSTPEGGAAAEGEAPALKSGVSVLYDHNADTAWEWEKVACVVTPEADGTYYFAFQAYSPKDWDYIYLTAFEVKSNSFLPAPVENLKIVPAVDGSLKAELSWTLPTVDADGAPIAEDAVFEKVIIKRDGNLLRELDGKATSFTDTEADGLTAGKHTYSVEVIINGVTSMPTVIESRHIGPIAAKTLPWTAEISKLDADSFAEEYLVIRGEKTKVPEAYGWSLKNKAIQFDPRSKSNREDDWLFMPKVKFEKEGVYRLRVSASYADPSVDTNLELYLSKGRSAEEATIKAGVFKSLPESQSDTYVAFEITEPCEYYLALHAGREEAKSAKSMIFYEFTVEETVALPVNVESLALTEGDGSVTLSWTTPKVNNAGQSVGSYSKIEVLRDGEVIKTFTDVVGGSEMQYVDTPEQGGIFSYSVIPYIGESQPDSKAPILTTGWVGDRLQQLPYIVDFSDSVDTNREKALWEIFDLNNEYEDSSDKWSIASSSFTLSLDWDGGNANDILVTPPFIIEEGIYDLTLKIKGAEAGFPLYIGCLSDTEDLTSRIGETKIELNGAKSYTEYNVSIRIDEDFRGSFFIASDPEFEYDYDLSNLMINCIKIQPREIVEIPFSASTFDNWTALAINTEETGWTCDEMGASIESTENNSHRFISPLLRLEAGKNYQLIIDGEIEGGEIAVHFGDNHSADEPTELIGVITSEAGAPYTFNFDVVDDGEELQSQPSRVSAEEETVKVKKGLRTLAMHVDKATKARLLSVELSERSTETGVDSVVITNLEGAEYYDMTGMRVAKPVKGKIYIVRLANGQVLKLKH